MKSLEINAFKQDSVGILKDLIKLQKKLIFKVFLFHLIAYLCRPNIQYINTQRNDKSRISCRNLD